MWRSSHICCGHNNCLAGLHWEYSETAVCCAYSDNFSVWEVTIWLECVVVVVRSLPPHVVSFLALVDGCFWSLLTSWLIIRPVTCLKGVSTFVPFGDGVEVADDVVFAAWVFCLKFDRDLVIRLKLPVSGSMSAVDKWRALRRLLVGYAIGVGVSSSTFIGRTTRCFLTFFREAGTYVAWLQTTHSTVLSFYSTTSVVFTNFRSW